VTGKNDRNRRFQPILSTIHSFIPSALKDRRAHDPKSCQVGGSVGQYKGEIRRADNSWLGVPLSKPSPQSTRLAKSAESFEDMRSSYYYRGPYRRGCIFFVLHGVVQQYCFRLDDFGRHSESFYLKKMLSSGGAIWLVGRSTRSRCQAVSYPTSRSRFHLA
jgi:hypothetical protein